MFQNAIDLEVQNQRHLEQHRADLQAKNEQCYQDLYDTVKAMASIDLKTNDLNKLTENLAHATEILMKTSNIWENIHSFFDRLRNSIQTTFQSQKNELNMMNETGSGFVSV